MNGILDYIKWRGDVPFYMSPFNDVDMVVLCEVSYLPLQDIVSDDFKERLSLREVCEKCAPLPKIPFHKEGTELAKLIAGSVRYKDISISGFVNIVDEVKQFCAMTFEFSRRNHLVVFKGTDDSLIGWKENLDLSYKKAVPSQKCAVEYIEEVFRTFKGKLKVAGHSKGGNLAVYGSAFCSEKVNGRIGEVYNLDGPGFNEKLIKDEKFQALAPRIKTFVPQDSIVGLLLEHKEPYTVIHSSGKNGLEQHSLFTWDTSAFGLVTLDDLGAAGKVSDENLDEWISGLSYEQKKEFIGILYSLTEGSKTIGDVSWKDLLKAYNKLDKNQKHTVTDVVGQLGSTIKDNIIEYLKEKTNK